MARPRNITRTVDVHMLLPEPLMSRIYALLISDLDGKIPQGAQAKFFAAAAQHYLTHLETQHGQDNNGTD
jgi:hypothetical protein